MAMESYKRSSCKCPWCTSSKAVIDNGIFKCNRCGYTKDVSKPPPIEVIGWTYSNDRDYLERDCDTEELYDAIVNEVREKGYLFSWLEHQSEVCACTPIINNGYKISCGPRTWGSIMAAARGADDNDISAYAEYAFGFIEDPVYPERKIDNSRIIPFEINKTERKKK